MKNAEQDCRIAGIAISKVSGIQVEAERKSFHQRVRELAHGVQVFKHRFAEAGNIGEEVAAVQWNTGPDPGMVVSLLYQFGKRWRQSLRLKFDG